MTETVGWDEIEKMLIQNGLRMEWQNPVSPARGEARAEQLDRNHWEIKVSLYGNESDYTLISEKGELISQFTYTSVSDYEFSVQKVYEFFSRNSLEVTEKFQSEHPQPGFVSRVPNSGPERVRERERFRTERLERQRERLEREKKKVISTIKARRLHHGQVA